MKNWIYIFLVSLVYQGCGPQERVSKDVFDAVNKNMEVKKLSEAVIIQEAMIWGDSISIEAQKQLMDNLQKAIEDKGVSGAIGFCNVEALPVLKTVSEKHGVVIRRVSNLFRNPADQPDSEEAKILDAYEYNAENRLKNDPNIQKIEGGEVYLYTKAIIIPGGFCLSCHGDPVKDIDAKTIAEINALYPADKAKNHKIGDLRGMWSIKIPKKEVVDRL